MSAYQREVLVRFAHCDPAGIVFHARYFEMINGVVEDWFEDGLEVSFAGLLHHRNLATPTVHFTVDFANPSMMGDRLTFSLEVVELGKRSCHLAITVSCRGEERVRVKQILVFTDAKANKAKPIPADLLRRIRHFLNKDAEDRSKK